MHEIKFIDEVLSTNALAKDSFDELKHFDVISADMQSKGHGQFGRSWFCSNENGGNCYISIVLKPTILKNLDKLTQFASLKVAQTLKTYGLEPTFKFPNDVLIRGKKIAGVLAESIFLGDKLKGVAVGIGVNLNLSSVEVQKIDVAATSVFLETNKKINKKAFINKLLDIFERDFDNFIKNEEKGEILCFCNC